MDFQLDGQNQCRTKGLLEGTVRDHRVSTIENGLQPQNRIMFVPVCPLVDSCPSWTCSWPLIWQSGSLAGASKENNSRGAVFSNVPQEKGYGSVLSKLDFRVEFWGSHWHIISFYASGFITWEPQRYEEKQEIQPSFFTWAWAFWKRKHLSSEEEIWVT